MSRGPWSIKGIDSRARALAREEALRSGVTLGEYINRLLLDANGGGDRDDGRQDGRDQAYPDDPIYDPDPQRLRDAIEQVDRMSASLRGADASRSEPSRPAPPPAYDRFQDELFDRAPAAPRPRQHVTSASAAVRDPDGARALKDVLSRLESTERGQAGLASRFDGAMNDLRATQAELRDRVEMLAGKDSSRRSLDAMRALEAALSRLAREMYDTKSKVAEDQADLRQQLQTGLGRMDQVEGRIEENQKQVEATLDRVAKSADRLAEFQESADERLEQAVKRADAAFDNTHSKTEEIAERLAEARRHAAAAEARAAAAEDAAQSTDARVVDLRRSVQALANATDDKLDEALGLADQALSQSRQASDAMQGLRNETTSAIDSLKAHNDARIAEALNQTADAVETSATSNKKMADRLFSKVDDLETELRAALDGKVGPTQQNVAAMMGRVSEVTNRVEGVEKTATSRIKELKAAMARYEERLQEAEKSNTQAIRTLDERLDGVETRVAETDELRDTLQNRLNAIAETVSQNLQSTREDLERRISETVAGAADSDAIARLEDQIQALQAQVAEAENSQAEAVETIGQQFERISTALDKRLRAVEERDGSEAVEDVRREMQSISSELEQRLDTIENRESTALETVAHEVSRMADKLEGRIRDTEARSAEAIEQVGDQVVRVAERIQSRSEDAIRELGARMDAAGQAQDQRLNSAMEEVARRIDDISEAAQSAIAPVQNTVASLARRLESIEDMDIGAAPPPFEGPVMFAEDADDAENIVDLDSYGDSDDAPPPFGPPPAELDDDLDDKAISASAHSARREFASTLAEHLAESEEDGDELPSAFAADDLSAELETDIAPDAEYEADLPPPDLVRTTPDALRFDQGEDDDPFGRASRNSIDFLSNARQAALERGSDNNRVLASAADEGASSPSRKTNRLPMVAAGALAIAVAGGAGMMLMRGKQSGGEDAFAALTPDGDPGHAGGAHDVGHEDDFDLFDSAEEAVAAGLATSHPSASHDDHGAGPEIDEEILFPEDARILTAENIRASQADHASGHDSGHGAPPAQAETPLSAPPTQAGGPRRASALEAFASRPAHPSAAAVPAPRVTLESAARKGDPIALHDLALQQMASGDKRAAAESLTRAATQGLAMAQYRLGKLYERGEGVPRSVKESRQWTEKAAIGGNVKAMHDLAVFYAEGDGGEQNYAAAVEWFTRAADHGLVDSQYNLGVLYEQGLGVTRNIGQAALWFEISGMRGDADGARRARELMQQLSPNETDTIQRRARTFAPSASDPRANGDFGRKLWESAGRADIMEAQRLLNLAGFDVGEPDGVIGNRTRAAIRRFEASHDMTVTGNVTSGLMESLRSSLLETQA